MIDPSELPKLAQQKNKENKKFFNKLRSKSPKNLDDLVEEIHDEVFDRVDCLNCANCCKTTGPLFTNKDIERISKHLRMKPGDFVHQYLRIDEEQDYVLQSVPCAFLGTDNYCSIYEVRPKACREFPHTDHSGFASRAKINLANTSVCPAFFEIVEGVKQRIPVK